MPQQLRVAAFTARPIQPVYSRHARDKAEALGFMLPEVVVLQQWRLVEVEVQGDKAVKLVVRRQYDGRRDLVMVLLANGVCKTVWSNDTTDRHKTLNRAAYVQPPLATARPHSACSAPLIPGCANTSRT
jgi:hypothetical protein